MFCRNAYPHQREGKSSLLLQKKWRDLPFLCSIINYIAGSFHNKTWWERGAPNFRIYCYLYWPMFITKAWLEWDAGSYLQAQGSCCCWALESPASASPTSPSCRLPLPCWLAEREELWSVSFSLHSPWTKEDMVSVCPCGCAAPGCKDSCEATGKNRNAENYK